MREMAAQHLEPANRPGEMIAHRFLCPFDVGAADRVQNELVIRDHCFRLPVVKPLEVQPPNPSVNARWIPGYWHYADRKFHWIVGLWQVPDEDARC